MKRTLILLCAIIFLAQGIKSEINAETLEKDTTIQGIKFPKGTNVFYASDKLTSVKLKQDQEIQGILCAKNRGLWGQIFFYENGKIHQAELAKNQEIQGILCGIGSVVFFNSGKLLSAFLAGDQEIQGIPCAKSSQIILYESGKIRWAELAKDQEIQGILCGKGHIEFYESGKLGQTILARDQEIQGLKLIKGCEVSFDESGKVKETMLARDREIPRDQEIQGLKLIGHAIFDKSGKLQEAVLAQDQEIQGIFCRKGRIQFYESGKLGQAILASDPEIQGIKFPKETRITFYESGRLWNAVLGQDQEIKGLKLAKETEINFLESGQLWLVTLAQDQEIQGIFCRKGRIQFYESGKLLNAILASEQEIQGLKLAKGDDVTFDNESGKLESVVLGRTEQVQSIIFAPSDKLFFYESGKLKAARLAQDNDQEIQGVFCAKGRHLYLYDYDIVFYESGELEQALLAQAKEIQGVPCTEGSRISFYKSGKLRSVSLTQDQNIQNILCAKGAQAFFYESGKLQTAVLAQNQRIQRILCLKDKEISLYESGKLECAELAEEKAEEQKEEQEIQGIKFAKGCRISFDKSGKLGPAILIAQNYLKKYKADNLVNVSVRYSSPNLLENNDILSLQVIHCWSHYGDGTPRIKIIKINRNSLIEETLLELDPKNYQGILDVFNFRADTKGNLYVLEPPLQLDMPKTLKILIIDLRTKKQSYITRRGTGYRISPDGRFLIYRDMGSAADDSSKKKTIYLTDLEGKIKDAIYETREEIKNWSWVDNDTIEICFYSHIKFINIHTKKVINLIRFRFKEFIDEWDPYAIRYRTSSDSNNEFAIKENSEGDLILINLMNLENRALKRGFDNWGK